MHIDSLLHRAQRARAVFSFVMAFSLVACDSTEKPDTQTGDDDATGADDDASDDDVGDDDVTDDDVGDDDVGDDDDGEPKPPLDAGAGKLDAAMDGSSVVDASTSDAESVGDPDDASAEDASQQGQDASGLDASGDASGDASVDPSVDGAVDDAGVTPDASGPTLPPFPTDGEPLTAPARTWTYIEFPDTKCRDGSPAGLSVSLNPSSSKVLLYLEGGGACFDRSTCSLASSANVDGTNLILSAPGTGANINSAKRALTEGIFDRNNSENPIRDWNIVYVPYCTGDIHGGNQEGPVDVPGLGAPRRQWFVGQSNIKKFLNRIVPTFPNADDVLLAGVSAGGYGTLGNLYLVQRAFPNVKVKHVNDSGAPLSKAVSPECLQRQFRELWKLDLSPCGAACPNQNDFTQAQSLWVANFFSDRPGGFIDTTEDSVISLFLGTGNNNCRGEFPIDRVEAATYRAEVLAYADKLKAFPNYGAFTPSGDKHTFLRTNDFYTIKAGGVRLVDWFTKIIGGEAPGQARD